MNKNINDILNKHFQDTIILPDINYHQDKYKIYMILSESIGKYQISEEKKSDILNILENQNIEEYFETYFKSMRNIIFFLDALDKECKKYINYINAYDLIILSFLKSCDIEFYNKILNEGFKFSFKEFIPKYNDYFDIISDTVNPDKKKYYEEFIKDLTTIQKDILVELFPNLKKFERPNSKLIKYYNEYDKIIYENRFAGYFVFNLYKMTYLTDEIENYKNTQQSKEKLLEILNIEYSCEIDEVIKKFLPEGDSNYNIRYINLFWIKDQIKSKDLDLIQSRKLIKALSHITKEHLSLKEFYNDINSKLFSSYILLDYLEKSIDKELIIEIIKDELSSDSYVTTVTYSLISEENEDKSLVKYKSDNIFKIEVAKMFIERMKSKGIPEKSIFLENISDDSLQLLFRWKDCKNFLDKMGLNLEFIEPNKYLKNLFKKDFSNFKIFINYFVNLLLPKTIQYEQLNQILVLIDRSDLKEVLEYYEQKGININLNQEFLVTFKNWVFNNE